MPPTPYKIFTYNDKERIAVIPEKVVAILEMERQVYDKTTHLPVGKKKSCTLFVAGEDGGEGGNGLNVDGALEEVIAHLKGSES